MNALESVSGDWWVIIYEDQDMKPELFMDEMAARETFAERQVAWSCHLFHRVPTAETKEEA